MMRNLLYTFLCALPFCEMPVCRVVIDESLCFWSAMTLQQLTMEIVTAIVQNQSQRMEDIDLQVHI